MPDIEIKEKNVVSIGNDNTVKTETFLEITKVMQEGNVYDRPIIYNAQIRGADALIGSGNSVLGFNSVDGLWIGNAVFASAPFRVTIAGAVTGTSMTITSGDLTSSFLNAGSVDTAELVDLAVQTAKLNDLAVSTDKIAALAITTAKIDNLAVTNAKINDLAVSKLTAGTITSKTITLAVSDGTGDAFISAGKTDFGQDATAGFILGIDDSVAGNPALFEIGSGATKILKYDGTDFTLTGGIITGGTIQTAASGQRIVMASNSLKSYNSDGNQIFGILESTSQIQAWSYGASNAATFLGASGTQTADIILIQNANSTDATAGRSLNVSKNVGTRELALFNNVGGTGVTAIFQQYSTAGVECVRIFQADLDKTGLFIKDAAAQDVGNNALLEVRAITGSMYAAEFINNNATNAVIKVTQQTAGGFAFEFGGNEYDASITSVSGVTGAIRVKTSDGTVYIPVYSTAS